MEHRIVHDEEHRRFTVSELGHEAYLEYYRLPDGTIDYSHTYTPNEIRGRGVASAIIRHALDHARENGWTIVPGCPFVQTFIDRHPDYEDLLEPTWRHRSAQDPDAASDIAGGEN